jgi:hypothetical protein
MPYATYDQRVDLVELDHGANPEQRSRRPVGEYPRRISRASAASRGTWTGPSLGQLDDGALAALLVQEGVRHLCPPVPAKQVHQFFSLSGRTEEQRTHHLLLRRATWFAGLVHEVAELLHTLVEWLRDALAQWRWGRIEESISGSEVRRHVGRPEGKLALSYLGTNYRPKACLHYASSRLSTLNHVRRLILSTLRTRPTHAVSACGTASPTDPL